MKINKIFYFLNILFLITNFTIAQELSGEFRFTNQSPSFTLNSGSGIRSYEQEISFDKPFDFKPFVYVTNTFIDAISTGQLRYSIQPRAISRDGFIVRVTIWGDTKLNGIGGNWFASALQVKENTPDLDVIPVEVGETIILNNITFEFDKSVLKSESFSELNNVVDFLNNYPSVEIELSGHTDNVGKDEYNQKLSEDRAKAVTDYLVSKGIAQNRLIARGYGEKKPIASNDSEGGREINRRVEFTILKK